MKKLALTFLFFCLSLLSFGQQNYNQTIIKLAKVYDNFMFRNELTKTAKKDLEENVSKDFEFANKFIIETITSKNKILSNEFLSRPNENVLKQIYIIDKVRLNLIDEKRIEENKLIDSLIQKNIPSYEMLDNYYGMIFVSIGNKNQPFNLSKVDLKIDGYNLKDETEKAILYFNCMKMCGSSIWGYMNIPNPPNTKEALKYIKNFPKINGMPYYSYNDFYFPDFEMEIIKDKGMQRYKSYYINKLYETLLYHLICLNKEKRSEKEKDDLLLGSIMRKSNLYKYTEHKDILEDIFKRIENK